jgi:hypothetical protein
MKTYSRLIILITAIISWGCQESTNTSSETSLQVSPPPPTRFTNTNI